MNLSDVEKHAHTSNPHLFQTRGFVRVSGGEMIICKWMKHSGKSRLATWSTFMRALIICSVGLLDVVCVYVPELVFNCVIRQKLGAYVGLKFQTTQNSRIYSKRAIKLLTGGIIAAFERSQDFTFNHAGL